MLVNFRCHGLFATSFYEKNANLSVIILLFFASFFQQYCTIYILNNHHWAIRYWKQYSFQVWIWLYSWNVQIIDIKLEMSKLYSRFHALPTFLYHSFLLTNLSRSSMSLLFGSGSIANFSNVAGCSIIIEYQSLTTLRASCITLEQDITWGK